MSCSIHGLIRCDTPIGDGMRYRCADYAKSRYTHTRYVGLDYYTRRNGPDGSWQRCICHALPVAPGDRHKIDSILGGHRPADPNDKARQIDQHRLGSDRDFASRDLTMNDIADHGVRFGRIAAMLPVTEMSKAHEFYTKVLGFEKIFENGNPVGFMILKRDQAELHLSLQPHHKAATFNVAHLMVHDIDALHAVCQQHGLRIIKRLQNKDYGLRAFVFADPDGNRIDVGQVI